MRLHLLFLQRFLATFRLSLPAFLRTYLISLQSREVGEGRVEVEGVRWSRGVSISPVFQAGNTFQNDARRNHGGESHPGECDISNCSVCLLLL